MVGESPEQARRQHAGEAGHIDADAEVEAAQHPDVDAERRDRVEVARAGADAHAQPRIFEHGEQAADGRRDDDHHEHAIAGEEEVLARQRGHQPARDLKRNALRAPDEARHVLEDVGEAEGQEQAVERVFAIERADQQPLDDEAEHCGQRRRNDQRAPKTDIGDQRVGQIGAERQKSAVGEIDDPAEVEDQRQAKRHQGVERADDQAVEDVEKDDLAHASVFAGRRNRAAANSPLLLAGSSRWPGHLAAALLKRAGRVGAVDNRGDFEQVVRRRALGLRLADE